MRFVLDNSVIGAWALDEKSDYADSVGECLAVGEALVRSIRQANPKVH